MRSPLGFYVELVDGSAFDKAESGATVTQFDPPVLPLLFPWVIGGPALAFLPLGPDWSSAVFGASIFASVACWVAFMTFYYRRVKHYRNELGARREVEG